MARRKKTERQVADAAIRRQSPIYIKPGVEAELLMRMQRPLYTEAMQALERIYGSRPKPSNGKWFAYLISLGTEQALKRYAS